MFSVSNDHGRPQGGNEYLLPWKLGLRTFKAFCQRPFVLKPEKNKHDVDVSHLQNSCGRPW